MASYEAELQQASVGEESVAHAAKHAMASAAAPADGAKEEPEVPGVNRDAEPAGGAAAGTLPPDQQVLAVPISEYNQLVAETLENEGTGTGTPASSAAGSRYASSNNVTSFNGPRGSTGTEAIEMQRMAQAGDTDQPYIH